MRTLITTLACLLTAAVVTAKSPSLSFSKEGEFRIVQFTDLHLRSFNVEETETVYSTMADIIDAEKPDLVVLSGDNVTCNPAEPEWRRLMGFFDSLRQPWVTMFGNHDHQQELSKAQMSSLIVSSGYNLNSLNEEGLLADEEIPVKSGKGRDAAFYVYCLDSHDYSTVLEERCYDWFTPSQVSLMRDRVKARTAPDGTVAPSFAFFHIPLREYIDAWASHDDPREGASSGSQGLGVRGECICCGGLNTGMFAAMKEGGSVIGTSVGHDHDNDFVATYHGIALCYGRCTACNTVYSHLPQGARVIVMHEGEKGFETWIRERGGRVVRHCLFDGDKLIKQQRVDRSEPNGLWHPIVRQ